MVWIPGYYGVAVAFEKMIQQIIHSSSFNKFIIVAVLLNTISLGMEGLKTSTQTTNFRNNANVCFTYIFIVEMFLKLIGMGLVGNTCTCFIDFTSLFQGFNECFGWVRLHCEYRRDCIAELKQQQ